MTKQKIQTNLENITDMLNGVSIKKAIKSLSKLLSKYDDEAKIVVDYVPDPYEDYDEYRVSIVAEREENDYEYAKRLRDEAEIRHNDLAQLAFLKKKYEGEH